MGYIPTITFQNDDINTIFIGLNLDQVKSLTFDTFLPNIEKAIEKNKKNIVFCYAADEYQIVINEKDYNNTLNILENYYKNKENYEICAKIKKLKDVIEERRFKAGI